MFFFGVFESLNMLGISWNPTHTSVLSTIRLWQKLRAWRRRSIAKLFDKSVGVIKLCTCFVLIKPVNFLIYRHLLQWTESQLFWFECGFLNRTSHSEETCLVSWILMLWGLTANSKLKHFNLQMKAVILRFSTRLIRYGIRNLLSLIFLLSITIS